MSLANITTYADIDVNDIDLPHPWSDPDYCTHTAITEAPKLYICSILNCSPSELEIVFKAYDANLYGALPLVWPVQEITPIMTAAIAGCTDSLEILLRRTRYDIDEKLKSSGATALAIAAGRGDEKMVSALLRHQSMVDSRLTDGSTPLVQAVWGNHSEVVDVLLEHGAAVELYEYKNHTDILATAISLGNIDIVKAIVQRTGLPFRQCRLCLALDIDREDIADYLVAAGSGPDQKTQFGVPLLVLVASYNHLNAVRYLISRGGNVNIQGSRGETALMMASWENNFDILKALLDYGADVSIEDKENLNAYDHAMDRQNYYCAALLLGADNNHCMITLSLILHNEAPIASLIYCLILQYGETTQQLLIKLYDYAPAATILAGLYYLYHWSPEDNMLSNEEGRSYDDHNEDSQQKTIHPQSKTPKSLSERPAAFVVDIRMDMKSKKSSRKKQIKNIFSDFGVGGQDIAAVSKMMDKEIEEIQLERSRERIKADEEYYKQRRKEAERNKELIAKEQEKIREENQIKSEIEEKNRQLSEEKKKRENSLKSLLIAFTNNEGIVETINTIDAEVLNDLLANSRELRIAFYNYRSTLGNRMKGVKKQLKAVLQQYQE